MQQQIQQTNIDLYETLYEKTQSSDQSYVAQISQLSKRCADLERELSLLRKTHHTPMLAEAAKAAEVSSAVTPMDLARMMAAGVKELEGKSSEVILILGFPFFMIRL